MIKDHYIEFTDLTKIMKKHRRQFNWMTKSEKVIDIRTSGEMIIVKTVDCDHKTPEHLIADRMMPYDYSKL